MSVFRIAKKGATLVGAEGRFGDEYVRVKVEVPKRVNRKDKKLWEELGGE